jgi:hypothetical protein
MKEEAQHEATTFKEQIQANDNKWKAHVDKETTT